MSRWFGWLGALCVLMLVCGAAWAADAKAKEVPPSFAPGAEVELVFEISAPKDWHLNEGMPLSLSFDEKYLKDAPFTTKTPSSNISVEVGDVTTHVSLTVKLKSGLADGTLKLPVKLACVVCDEFGDSCVMVRETFDATVVVLGKAPKGTKNQAQSKGENPLKFQIAPVA